MPLSCYSRPDGAKPGARHTSARLSLGLSGSGARSWEQIPINTAGTRSHPACTGCGIHDSRTVRVLPAGCSRPGACLLLHRAAPRWDSTDSAWPITRFAGLRHPVAMLLPSPHRRTWKVASVVLLVLTLMTGTAPAAGGTPPLSSATLPPLLRPAMWTNHPGAATFLLASAQVDTSRELPVPASTASLYIIVICLIAGRTLRYSNF